MSNLIKAEFFKLKKSVAFRTCLIVFFCSDIMYLIILSLANELIGIDITGYAQFTNLMNNFCGSTVSGMLFGFLAAALITSDYKTGDIQCAIAQGYSRAQLLISKIIMYMTAVAILALEDVLVYTVGGTIAGGFGVKLTGDVFLYLLRSVVLEGFVLAMMYTTCIFLAFLFTSKAASVTINLLIFFVIDMGVGIMPMLIEKEWLDKLISYLPYKSVAEMSLEQLDWSHAGISLAFAAFYGICMIAASWIVFRKKDMNR